MLDNEKQNNDSSDYRNDGSVVIKTVVHHSILDKYSQPGAYKKENNMQPEVKSMNATENKTLNNKEKEHVASSTTNQQVETKVETKSVQKPLEKKSVFENKHTDNSSKTTNSTNEVSTEKRMLSNKPSANNRFNNNKSNNHFNKKDSTATSNEEKTKDVRNSNKVENNNATVNVHKEHKRNTRRVVRNTGPQLAEKVIEIKRISKTTKGGRRLRFSALVVVGDKKGQIGYGLAKANEVPDALKKAIKKANNNLVKVKMTKRGSLFHEIIGHSSSGKVLLKPAPEGTGLIAGGPIRAVIELAGYSDIYTKNKGTNSSINMVRATINGLLQQRNAKDVATARDLPVEKIFR